MKKKDSFITYNMLVLTVPDPYILGYSVEPAYVQTQGQLLKL